MQSRLDKYENNKEEIKKSRTEKNKYIYDNINMNNDLSYISKIPSFNIEELKMSSKSREDYQKSKSYLKEEVKSPKDLSMFFNENNKNYDINEVLEEAKKNKEVNNERRMIKNTNYNILSNLNNTPNHPNLSPNKSLPEEQTELEELINTITRKDLTNEKDLLFSLMATKFSDNILSEEIAKEIKPNKEEVNLNKVENIVEDRKETKEMDKSFYTKSMDLSEFDFDIDTPNSKNKMWINIILIISLALIMIVVIYFLFFKI